MMRTRSASTSALLDARDEESVQLRDAVRALRSLRSLSPIPPESSSLEATASEGEAQQGTEDTIPFETLSQATPIVPHNAWAGDSFLGSRETPRRLLPAPVYRDHCTPGQASVLNDELVAMRLMIHDMKTVMNELRECVVANTTTITQLSSPNFEHAIPPVTGGSIDIVEGANHCHDVPFTIPRRTAKSPTSRDAIPPLQLANRFSSLAVPEHDPNESADAEQHPAHRQRNLQPSRQLQSDNQHGSQVQPPFSINRRPAICCTESHLNNFKPVRPGSASYAQATRRGRRAFILSDSMMQRIRKREFYQHSRAWSQIKAFPGATSRYLHHHMLPFILEQCPSVLVVHGGTNDLRTRDKTAEQIADDLLNIGHTAQSLGVETVMFSSLVIRRDGVPMDRKRKAVNRILRERCALLDNFIFVSNDNICYEDIDETDRIHLLECGSVKLANNILNSLNSLH